MSDFVQRLKAAAVGIKKKEAAGAIHQATSKLGKLTAKIRAEAERLFPHPGRD